RPRAMQRQNDKEKEVNQPVKEGAAPGPEGPVYPRCAFETFSLFKNLELLELTLIQHRLPSSLDAVKVGVDLVALPFDARFGGQCLPRFIVRARVFFVEHLLQSGLLLRIEPLPGTPQPAGKIIHLQSRGS